LSISSAIRSCNLAVTISALSTADSDCSDGESVSFDFLAPQFDHAADVYLFVCHGYRPPLPEAKRKYP